MSLHCGGKFRRTIPDSPPSLFICVTLSLVGGKMASCFLNPFRCFLRDTLFEGFHPFLHCRGPNLIHTRFFFASCRRRPAFCSIPGKSIPSSCSPVSLTNPCPAFFFSNASLSHSPDHPSRTASRDLEIVVSGLRAWFFLLASVFFALFLPSVSAFSLNRPGGSYPSADLPPPLCFQKQDRRFRCANALNCSACSFVQFRTWKKTSLNFLGGPEKDKRRPTCRDTQALWDSREERFAALKSMKEQDTPKFEAPDWTSDQPLLEIKDLHAEAVEDGQEILRGVSLTVMPGEIHAIMGRNGSGKSTLSKVLAGYPSYKVTGGTVKYKGLDLLELPIDNRGLAGVFLAFQYPIEIPMVSNMEFLRVAYNERRKWRQEPEVDTFEFRELVESKLKHVGLNPSFLDRPLNYGFSGGEKKRNEILQMIVLDPELIMLDETDSGLDVDSFNITACAIKEFSRQDGKSFLVTTHYKKLLDVLRPQKVHVMHAGRIVLSGSLDLARQIEAGGFRSIVEDGGGQVPEHYVEEASSYEEVKTSLSPSAAGGGRRNFDRLL
ncbi:iron-sulfur assembly atpase [Cystoisospora suis]|uniref:Iron-sulfur assembly atpase n=1 Tax=Cystoisospora suis TaxID=483139 RepID=A0A2C6JFD6_9APIC|nr:iron-sulfur assembly atpase [Cystoisospora suis]